MQAGHTFPLTDRCASILGEGHIPKKAFTLFSAQRFGIQNRSDVPMSTNLKVAAARGLKQNQKSMILAPEIML